MTEQVNDETLALTVGDCWLSAYARAVYLGLATPAGQINRRGFLERVACRPSFPTPLVIGSQKAWNKSEVARWADDERRIQLTNSTGGR